MFWNIKKLNWSGAIITISTVIFALVSIVSVLISYTNWQTQSEASRPYFTFKESPSIRLTDELNVELKFNNVGIHPAINLSSKSIVFDANLLQAPILVDDYTVVNDIPRDTTTSLLLRIKGDFLQANVNPHFVVIGLSYTDPITHKLYTQTLYTQWAGVIGYKIQPLIHVEASQKQEILNYLKYHHLLQAEN